MATKPIKFLELHYTMTQFLIIIIVILLYNYNTNHIHVLAAAALRELLAGCFFRNLVKNSKLLNSVKGWL